MDLLYVINIWWVLQSSRFPKSIQALSRQRLFLLLWEQIFCDISLVPDNSLKAFPGSDVSVLSWAWRGSNCRVHLSIGLHKGWAIEGAVRCPKGLGGKLYQKTGEHHNWRRESKKLTIFARGWRLEWCLCGSAAFFDHCPVEHFWSKEFVYELWTHFWTSKFRQWLVAGNWGW